MDRIRNSQAASKLPQQAESISQYEAYELAQNYKRMSAPLLLLTICMVCYGLIMLFSASLSIGYALAGDPLFYVTKQARFFFLGLVLMFVIARFTPIKMYNNFLFMIGAYGLTSVLLFLVLLAGVEGDFGAQRWFSLFGIKFQPSELAKVAVVFCLASYFSFIKGRQRQGQWVLSNPRKQLSLDGWLYIVVPACAIIFWLFMIVIQPHLSGAIITGLLALMMFLTAKIPAKTWLKGLSQMIPIGLVLLLLLALAFPLFKKGESLGSYVQQKFFHVTQRLETFQDPEQANDDEIHQVKQARLALGSGGLLGKGLGMSRQKSGYLPMVYNDYILSAIGEELGFLGTASVVVGFILFMFAGMFISLNASGLFAALMSWGCTFLIVLQALLNIAVAAEVIPATGISLPFFSYGGTANIFFLVAVGFILCVSRSGQKVDKRLQELLAYPKQGRRPPTRKKQAKKQLQFKSASKR